MQKGYHINPPHILSFSLVWRRHSLTSAAQCSARSSHLDRVMCSSVASLPPPPAAPRPRLNYNHRGLLELSRDPLQTCLVTLSCVLCRGPHVIVLRCMRATRVKGHRVKRKPTGQRWAGFNVRCNEKTGSWKPHCALPCSAVCALPCSAICALPCSAVRALPCTALLSCLRTAC